MYHHKSSYRFLEDIDHYRRPGGTRGHLSSLMPTLDNQTQWMPTPDNQTKWDMQNYAQTTGYHHQCVDLI